MIDFEIVKVWRRFLERCLQFLWMWAKWTNFLYNSFLWSNFCKGWRCFNYLKVLHQKWSNYFQMSSCWRRMPPKTLPWSRSVARLASRLAELSMLISETWRMAKLSNSSRAPAFRCRCARLPQIPQLKGRVLDLEFLMVEMLLWASILWLEEHTVSFEYKITQLYWI